MALPASRHQSKQTKATGGGEEIVQKQTEKDKSPAGSHSNDIVRSTVHSPLENKHFIFSLITHTQMFIRVTLVTGFLDKSKRNFVKETQLQTNQGGDDSLKPPPSFFLHSQVPIHSQGTEGALNEEEEQKLHSITLTPIILPIC
jgi:hypothetical protein